ncbi:MAG: chromosomal replication initiator protein DnaA [Spirochaetota bacterium]
MTDSTVTIWNKVLGSVETYINKQSFNMWFKNTEPVGFNENILIVKVPDDVAKRHISDHYASLIHSIIKEQTGKEIVCEFITGNGFKEPVINAPLPITNDDKKETLQFSTILNPNYTFENFVIGPNNQLAHAAAISVSKAPATQYNPLFIYGGTGLGKTHLMQAIGHRIIQERPYLNVLYVPCEQFINEFIQAIRANTLSSFKIKYRNVDILLIDDIQFIEKKEQTQEEFFHTFNTLHNSKKQIVISSDRPPKDLSTLEERLRTRFEWGMIVDIQLPNLETREAILRNKAEKIKIELSDEVCNYIARRIKSSIRALEAALVRLSMVSSIYKQPITVQLAKDHCKDLFDVDSNKKITVQDIMVKVASKFGVSVEDIISKNRQSKVVQPRFIAMYLARRLTELTTIEIGKEFGDRDHSTVLNAINNIEKSIEEDIDFKEVIDELISELRS